MLHLPLECESTLPKSWSRSQLKTSLSYILESKEAGHYQAALRKLEVLDGGVQMEHLEKMKYFAALNCVTFS